MSEPPALKMIEVELRLDPVTGQRCAYVFEVPGNPESRDGIDNELAAARLSNQYGTCTNSPRRPRATAPAPAVAAAQVWHDQVTLPAPQPRIAPGHAVTGMPAFLEDTAPPVTTGTFNAFGYAIEITATPASIDVDWGDGRVDRTTPAKLGPWPTGRVQHVYNIARPVTVTVTRRWTATWRIGDATGTVTEPLSTTATLELDVRQVQAVRNR